MASPRPPPRSPLLCDGCSPAAAQSASHPTRTPSGVFITCSRGSFHAELSVIRSRFIHSLLSYPRRGQFLVTLRGQFSMARDSLLAACLPNPTSVLDDTRTAELSSRCLDPVPI